MPSKRQWNLELWVSSHLHSSFPPLFFPSPTSSSHKFSFLWIPFTMFRLWKWYQNCLTFHPVKTQVISSGFLWGTGDIAAQYITHSAAKTHLPTSVSINPFIFLFGFIVILLGCLSWLLICAKGFLFSLIGVFLLTWFFFLFLSWFCADSGLEPWNVYFSCFC